MIAMISGGFDPLHVGHIDLIKLASAHGDVIVALNSDDWLRKKKGYVFMPYDERSRILGAIRCVVAVIPVQDEDATVCKVLKSLKPDFFINGGDCKEPNPAEKTICERLNIIQIFGGGKIQSSRKLVEAVQ